MIQILKNIREVSMIDAHDLANLTVIPGTGVLLNYWRPFVDLHVVGLAQCEVSSAVENGSRVYTTRLSANLAAYPAVDGRDLCFMITAVDGERYLIGMSEKPFPVVNTGFSMPDRASDRSGCTISVEYKDTWGLLPVLD